MVDAVVSGIPHRVWVELCALDGPAWVEVAPEDAGGPVLILDSEGAAALAAGGPGSARRRRSQLCRLRLPRPGGRALRASAPIWTSWDHTRLGFSNDDTALCRRTALSSVRAMKRVPSSIGAT